MAEAVAEAMNTGRTLVVEAGTGTGKTFAYLVPALLSGRRVVVSTGTRNLQDQLFHRDLPRLLAALKVPARTALLKGRGNYLCTHRLHRAQQTPGWRYDERLAQLDRWSRETVSGELADFGLIPENDPLYPKVTSTADNCLGSKCPDFGECHVVRARRAAQGADLVVVNHHLLFADFLLKQEGFGEILPGAQSVVVDEAHQLPELASQFFGARVSTRQLRDLAEDTQRESQEWGDMPDLDVAGESLTVAAEQLEAIFATLPARTRLSDFESRPTAPRALAETGEALEMFVQVSKAYEERGPGISALVDRAVSLQSRWSEVSDPSQDAGRVRWVEPRGKGGSLHATPVEISEGFTAMRGAISPSWILTSATLSAGGDFSHFCHRLGLDDARTDSLPSPFDYPNQTRLFLPDGLPDPNSCQYPDAIVDRVLPLIDACRGGAFILCTSHRALRQIAERLRQMKLRYPLFVQGDEARATLVDRFAEAGDALLVGTQSFWEGVDVRGRALRLVVIDRLPFAAPGDPVFEARLEAIRRDGGNPFMDHQLPEAIVTLRQGVGRLIRDVTDQGLLVLCDPRLRSKAYGRKILASLPPMPQVDAEGALQWCQSL